MKLIGNIVTYIVIVILLISVAINKIGINSWYISLPMNFHVKIGFYQEFKRDEDLIEAFKCLSPQEVLEGIRQLILPGLSIIILAIWILSRLT